MIGIGLEEVIKTKKKKLKDLKIQHEVKDVATKMHIEAKEPRDQELFQRLNPCSLWMWEENHDPNALSPSLIFTLRTFRCNCLML